MEKLLNNLEEDVLVINLEGTILFCNNILSSKLEYSKDEILNLNIKDILHRHKNKFIEELEDYIDKDLRFSFYTRDKNEIRISGKIILDNWNNEECIFIICKEYKEESYTKEDLETLLDKSPFRTWINNNEGKLIYANEVYAERHNLSKEEVIGKYYEDLWEEEDSKYFRSTDKYVGSLKKAIVKEELINYKEGNKQWYEAYKVPIIDKNGDVKAIGGIAKNITLLKELEDRANKSNYNNELKKFIDDSTVINNLNTELLYSIKNYISKQLKADGVSVYLYDYNNNSLIPSINQGINEEVFENLKPFNIDGDKIRSKFNHKVMDRFIPISNRHDVLAKKALIKAGVEVFGSYNITYNNESLGILVASYKRDNLPNEIESNNIKIICNNIASLIYSINLKEKYKKEFNKRIIAERELESFLATAVDLMIVTDDDGNFIKASIGWRNLLGWSKEELLKKKWTDIVYDEDIDYCLKSGFNKTSNKANKFRCRGNCKDGGYRWFEWSSIYIKERGVYVSTAVDITDEINAEIERKRYQDALHLERIRTEFFSNISHELKTPLNIIISAIQLIENYMSESNSEEIDPKNFLKYKKSIKQNSFRLLKLVNNLIDITRIDTGNYELQLRNVDIVSIVENIITSVANYIKGSDIELIFDTEEEEKIIACDVDKIERIIFNLISNAIKFTGAKGKIEVNLKIEDDFIVISVEDDGIGIPEDKIESIFDRFSLVDTSLTRMCEGSGIGLSIVKSLVDMHNGSIRAESKEGIGAKFIFSLPIKLVEKEAKDIINNTFKTHIEICEIEFSDIYDFN